MIYATATATVAADSPEADALYAAWAADRLAFYQKIGDEDRALHAARGEVWAADDQGVWKWRKE